MKRRILGFATLLLCIAGPHAASAAAVYPNTNVADNGGRLGLTLDGNAYTMRGSIVIKVLGADHGSPLEGTVVPGDYIYSVNSFNLRDTQDIIAIVKTGSPGGAATVWFFDSRNNYQAMRTNVRLISGSAGPQQAASSGSYCGDHPFLCLFGAIGVGWALSSASGASTDSGSQSHNCPMAPSFRDNNGTTIYKSQC